MRGRADDLHPLGEQRLEARPAIELAIPARRRLVPLPVDSAEIIGDRDLRGGGTIGERHRRAAEPGAVLEQVYGVIEMLGSSLKLLGKRTGVGGGRMEGTLVTPQIRGDGGRGR